MTVVVGVDPGARYTGLVVRSRDTLLHASLVVHDLDDADAVLRIGQPGIDRIMAAVDEALALAARTAVANGAAGSPLEILSSGADGESPIMLAVEDVQGPNPHIRRADGARSLTNPGAIIDTAKIVGALLGRWRVVLVPPSDRHGAAPPATYPAAIRAHRQRGAEPGGLLAHQREHCRCAWDVAGEATGLARFRRAALRALR